MLTVEELSVISRGSQRLKRISFHLPPRARLAIIGSNGAGKSTLLHALLGLITEREGRIEGRILLNGRAQAEYTRRELARLITLVPQEPPQLPEVTAHLWCEMALYSHKKGYFYTTPQEEALIAHMLEEFSLTAYQETPISQLSGGERQRLYLAAALLQQTPILLLDEPNRALDPKYQQSLHHHIVASCRNEGKTLLYITHDLNHIWGDFTHLLVLKEGALHYFGEVRDWLNTKNLTELYGVQFYEGRRFDGAPLFYQ